MDSFVKIYNKKLILSLILCLIAAILAELFIFSASVKTEKNGTEKHIYFYDADNYHETGYQHKSDGAYVTFADDPQIVFTDINCTVSSICIKFSQSQRFMRSLDVQVYYAEENQPFTVDNSTKIISTSLLSNLLIINIPKTDCQNLRIDIDGIFYLEDIIVSDKQFTNAPSMAGFNLLRVLLMFVLFGLAVFLYLKWFSLPKNNNSLSKFEFFFCIACFLFYSLWIFKTLNYGPDESMRYNVSKFFFENNRLPVNREAADPNWGFSYALLPAMLCNVLDYIPMKITSLFTGNPYTLLLSARMVSVFAGTGVVYFTIKASKQLFKTNARWIMVCFVAFLPQFAFISSYVNNDSLALLGISIILYAWTLALHNNWNYKYATLLCIGISIAALSYYNSYAWILASIFVFIISYWLMNKNDFKGFVKLSSFIIVLTFLLIGYLFVRHLYLYGDLLGFNTTHAFGEKYAIDALKPSLKITPHSGGRSLLYMLIDMGWLKTTYESFFVYFGPMAFKSQKYVYSAYTTLLLTGVIGGLVLIIKTFTKKVRKPTKKQVLFAAAIIGCLFITIGLSVYNSYVTDYQPQGRYCLPALPALAILLAKGIESLVGCLKNKQIQTVVVTVICSLLCFLTVDSFLNVFLLS